MDQDFRDIVREVLGLTEAAFSREEARQVLDAYTDGADVPAHVVAEALMCSERLQLSDAELPDL